MEKFLINNKAYKNRQIPGVAISEDEGVCAMICSHPRKNMSEFEVLDISIKYALEKGADDGCIKAQFEAKEKLINALPMQNKKHILVIGSSQEARDFAASCLHETSIFSAKDIKQISGKLGSVKLVEKSGLEVEADLVVSFVGEKLAKFSGLIRADEYQASELQARVNALCDKTYSPYFEDKYCDSCSLCVDACKELAIIQEGKEIIIDESKCNKCGSCISVCPQGAIKRAQLSKALLREIIKLYANKPLVLVSNEGFLGCKDAKISLENVGFIRLPSLNFSLDEYLLIVQELSASVLLIDPNLCKEARTNIAFINEISNKIYAKSVIFTAQTLTQENIDVLKGTPQMGLSYMDDEDFARGNLAFRLGAWVSKDYAKVASLANIFMDLEVNEDACTLCMACASVCKSDAFFGDASKKGLRFTPINCTHCNECLRICPEKCIRIKEEGLVLGPSFFTPRTLASDEEFCCVMCGAPFATKKSIERVATQMGPVFAGDERRSKALYCCATCKVKVMLSSV